MNDTIAPENINSNTLYPSIVRQNNGAHEVVTASECLAVWKLQVPPTLDLKGVEIYYYEKLGHPVSTLSKKKKKKKKKREKFEDKWCIAI